MLLPVRASPVGWAVSPRLKRNVTVGMQWHKLLSGSRKILCLKPGCHSVWIRRSQTEEEKLGFCRKAQEETGQVE